MPWDSEDGFELTSIRKALCEIASAVKEAPTYHAVLSKIADTLVEISQKMDDESKSLKSVKPIKFKEK